MSLPKGKKRKIGAIVALVLILAPVAFWAGRKFLVSTQLTLLLGAPPDKRFMDAWADDIQRLDRAHSLPPGFHDLRTIKLFTPSDHVKQIYKKFPLPLTTAPAGRYVLEIFVDEIDGGGVVVQYDLVEKKSGNTIWELGRTFPHNLEPGRETAQRD